MRTIDLGGMSEILLGDTPLLPDPAQINRSVGGRNLVPVAVSHDISQCTPVSGSYFGPNDTFLDMDVTVLVTASASGTFQSNLT